MRDGRLSWPCWLTDSGRLNHKVVTHPASSLAQDRESSPAETSVLTIMLRRQRDSGPCYVNVTLMTFDKQSNGRRIEVES